MARIIQYKGYSVLVGVNWTYDKSTLTVTMYPSRPYPKRLAYRPYKKVWKNKCPLCGRSGVLRAIGAKGRKTSVEGEVNCSACDADVDGVQGYEKINGSEKHLTPASLTPSFSNSKSNTSNTLSQLKAKEKKALGDVKLEYNQSKLPKRNMTLKIPPLPGIKDGYCHILLKPLVSTSRVVFVESVEITQTEITMQVNDKLEPPGEEYKPPSQNTGNTSSGTTSSSYRAVNYTAGSDIEKKIMAVGNSLKMSTDTLTVQKIFNFLKCKGKGGFNYQLYYDWPGGDIRSLNTGALAKHWNSKRGNCVWFAWAFYVMCKGAGIAVEIWHSAPHGNLMGHLWNLYKGRVYDLTLYRNHARDRRLK